MSPLNSDGTISPQREGDQAGVTISAERLNIIRQLLYELVKQANISQSELAVAMCELTFLNGVSHGAKMEKKLRNQPRANA